LKILYGVVGAGMGHAIRSGVLLERLVSQGHTVHVAASGNAVDYLSKTVGTKVRRIWGLTLVSDENEVDMILTAAANAAGALTGLPSNIIDFVDVQRKFQPDVVISDFETWSWFYGKLARIPILCIDNIQTINRCRHDPEIIAGHRKEFRLAKSIVKARTPGADQYLVSSFFPADVKKKRTRIVPPILRPNILECETRDDGHLLVYQSLSSVASLEESLSRSERPVLFYGHGLGDKVDVRRGSITFRPFHPTRFVEDLAGAHAVIGSAGFTLISEAIHLGKPYLARPIGNQFEQILNARYLEKLGYGMSCAHIDGTTLESFLGANQEMKERLATYPATGNESLFLAIDEFFDRCCAGIT
jgi:uncharacterized protein (TIGR00661 family)